MRSREQITRSIINYTVNPIVILFGATVIILLILQIVKIGKENQTYDQFIVCSLSVPALDRGQSRIDKCYRQAEDSTGVKIKHY